MGPNNYGPYDLPWSEISKIPDGDQVSIADLSRPHYSPEYGWHYDAKLLERHGSKLREIDRMHIDLEGNIIDP